MAALPSDYLYIDMATNKTASLFCNKEDKVISYLSVKQIQIILFPVKTLILLSEIPVTGHGETTWTDSVGSPLGQNLQMTKTSKSV